MPDVEKKTIPHVGDANGDPAVVRAHARHAWEQIEGGHYGLENLAQEDLGDGRVRLSFDRVETDPSVPAAPHGL